MKIILITGLFPSETNLTKGSFNIERLEALRQLGHDVTVVVPVSYTPPLRYLFPVPNIKNIVDHISLVRNLPGYEIIGGIHVYRLKRISLPYKMFWKYDVKVLDVFNGNNIRRILNHYKADFIITSGLNPSAVYSKYIKKYLDVPILSIFEGSDILIAPKKYRGIDAMINIINQNVDQCIFVSNSFKDDVIKEYKFDNIAVINNGYQNDIFYYDKDLNTHSINNVNIITVGHLEKIKGHDILLEAFKTLSNDYSLTIIGDGKMMDRYKSLALKYGIQNRVSFIGHISQLNIKRYLDNADIFCMPSRSESFGIAALEAMACGLPVIGANVGGIKELILNGFNGYFFSNGSVQDLIEMIKKASTTKWNHGQIASWARENYSWEKWAMAVVENYNSKKGSLR
jgi:glycosyltransferase involved in cell wall biosynthesis